MIDTPAPRFTSQEIHEAAERFEHDANQLHDADSLSDEQWLGAGITIGMLRQAAADLAALPTEDELKVAVREYAAGVRDYDDPEGASANKARAADIAAILSAHAPYIINALIAAGVRVRA